MKSVCAGEYSFGHQLQQNYTLELLDLELTSEANDDQFIRDVEMLTEQYNNSRQSHGVTTLQVKLYFKNNS